jgi:hypothetical protein
LQIHEPAAAWLSIIVCNFHASHSTIPQHDPLLRCLCAPSQTKPTASFLQINSSPSDVASDPSVSLADVIAVDLGSESGAHGSSVGVSVAALDSTRCGPCFAVVRPQPLNVCGMYVVRLCAGCATQRTRWQQQRSIVSS